MKAAHVVLAALLLVGCADGDLGGSATRLRDWGTKTVLGGVNLKVQTKWRDGNLLYHTSLTPFDSVRAFFAHRVLAEGAPEADPGELVPYALSIELVDADGFKVDSIAIHKSELVEDWGSRSFELRGSGSRVTGRVPQHRAVAPDDRGGMAGSSRRGGGWPQVVSACHSESR